MEVSLILLHLTPRVIYFILQLSSPALQLKKMCWMPLILSAVLDNLIDRLKRSQYFFRKADPKSSRILGGVTHCIPSPGRNISTTTLTGCGL